MEDYLLRENGRLFFLHVCRSAGFPGFLKQRDWLIVCGYGLLFYVKSDGISGKNIIVISLAR